VFPPINAVGTRALLFGVNGRSSEEENEMKINGTNGRRHFNRRRFLRIAGLSGAALFIPWSSKFRRGFDVSEAFGEAPLDPSVLRKYVDPLPVPHVLRGERHVVPIIPMKEKLHRDLPPTRLWGFFGKYPGPTFEAKKNRPIRVIWESHLPDAHLLPVDPTLHGAEDSPAVRTVVHLHGAQVGPESDGYPEAWFTRNFKQVGPAFTTESYYYPNSQPATTLWYHDHSLGITRLNVYAGLAGFYLIRDEIEDSSNLPQGKFEIPLLIQDRSFNQDGSLFYPDSRLFFDGFPGPYVPEPGATIHPVWNPEFFANTILVNGKVWPFLRVEPRRYRLRILNGCGSRFLNLKFDNSLTLTQIGTDGGFLASAVEVDEILLAPAERADVIVDFSSLRGQKFLLLNTAPDEPFGGFLPDPNNPDTPPPPNPDTTGQVMQIRVDLPLSGRDESELPASFPFVQLLESDVVTTRDVTLNENLLITGSEEFPISALLGTAAQALAWEDNITENPRSGATEIWRIINTTEDTHPIHLHLVQFQILDRVPFDVEAFLADRPTPRPIEAYYTGAPISPDPNEAGRKDTVRANPGEVTRIIAKFDLPNHVRPPAQYVWHCHILEHEDNEMMRPYLVEPRLVSLLK
jgi:spore coat protein A, manganese oxidase